MDLTTPLNRVLGLGTAKSGVEHWWVQRLSAAALVPLALWLAVSLMFLGDLSHDSVVAWMRAPVNAVLLLLTVVTVVYHSYLGIPVVIEDYVHGKGAKVAGLVLSAFAHFFLLFAAVFSVLKVAFGAAQ